MHFEKKQNYWFTRNLDPGVFFSGNYVTDYLAALIAWTKMIPQFETLKTDDRVYLVQSAWNEITIADIAHRSLEYEVSLFINKLIMILKSLIFKNKILLGCATYHEKRNLNESPSVAIKCWNYFRTGHHWACSKNERNEGIKNI